MKKETIRILEEMRNDGFFALGNTTEKEKIRELMDEIDALDDALCELRMMPAINRDELKKSLRYAQDNLVIDYDSMNYDQIKALDDSLDAIFGIVEKLIGEEEES